MSVNIERLLARERERLSRLERLSEEVQRRTTEVRRRIEALQLLADTAGPEEDAQLFFAATGAADGVREFSALPQTDRARDDGELRFSRPLRPFARDLIVATGPKTVEEIVQSLPADLRSEIEAIESTHPIGYRVRRAFRRAKGDFHVDRSTGRVSYVGEFRDGELPIVRRLLVEDGNVRFVDVEEPDGSRHDVPIDTFATEATTTRLYGVSGPGRISAVVFTDNLFRAYHRGRPNDDMRNVPREPLTKASK